MTDRMANSKVKKKDLSYLESEMTAEMILERDWKVMSD